MRPFGLAVCQKLLEHMKTALAVVQCVAEIATFVNPSRWNPAQRQTGKLPDLVFATTRTRVNKDCYVPLIGDPDFLEHRTTRLAIIPDGYETNLHLRIGVDYFGPAAAFELGLAIRAPRRPQVSHREFWRFDGIVDFLLGRRLCVQRTSRQHTQDQQAHHRHSWSEYGRNVTR